MSSQNVEDYRKKRATFRSSFSTRRTRPRRFQPSFNRIQTDRLSNARALKRRHRFENSKRRPASTIAKKGHGEKQFAGCHLRQSHGFSFARIKFAWTIERYSFFFSFLFSLSPSKLFQSLRVSSFMPNLLPFVFHDKHDDKINISSSTND